jgi:hypothetical protein
VDLIIPRGSNALVQFIQDNTRIPVLGHADGICHAYVDRAVDGEQALAIVLDSKTQYPAACNALETLLVNRAVAPSFLPMAIAALEAAGVELRGDEESRSYGIRGEATEEDWSTEYLDMILAVRVVVDLEEAMAHIGRYGSRHTELICTTDAATAETFLARVDSAGVYHNCSTRFADGFRYGFGAEVGISTQTLPPRGPRARPGKGGRGTGEKGPPTRGGRGDEDGEGAVRGGRPEGGRRGAALRGANVRRRALACTRSPRDARPPQTWDGPRMREKRKRRRSKTCSQMINTPTRQLRIA